MADHEREQLLDPVDRISEVLFGLIMAVTIVGSLSIATAGRADVQAVTWGALGCNVAWGMVDAVMYLVRTLTERTRNRALARRIARQDAAGADALIAKALPEAVAAIAGPEEIAGMRRRLLALPVDGRPLLAGRDYLYAFGIFVVVVVATFPVVLPFVLIGDVATAMAVSRVVTLAMLFAAGAALGRYAGHPRPVWTGIVMATLGAVLIVAVMALGG